ncbi:MAG TPA: hypothetical protein V6C88_15615 [Chroococcidiopsis sp.]
MSPLLQEVLRQVEQLLPAERLELVQKVLEGLKKPNFPENSTLAKRRVSEFYGIAPNLLEGRDAQEWVNELRDEWSERETGWS